jgi:hypothetical protein
MDMRNVHIAPFPPVLMFVSRRRMFAFSFHESFGFKADKEKD